MVTYRELQGRTTTFAVSKERFAKWRGRVGGTASVSVSSVTVALQTDCERHALVNEPWQCKSVRRFRAPTVLFPSYKGVHVRQLVPLHSDFDRLNPGQSSSGRHFGSTSISMLRAALGCRRMKACPFERQHHLVNRRRADAKILLHVGFGWRPAMQARVEVDERQILALLRREGFCGATHAGHPIQLFVRASNQEEARMNLRYRVELEPNRAQRTHCASERRQARSAQAQAGADFAGRRRRRQRR